MKKMKYVAPQTKSSEVELEQGFMAGSVFKEEKDTEDLTIEDHKVDETFDFSNDGWD